MNNMAVLGMQHSWNVAEIPLLYLSLNSSLTTPKHTKVVVGAGSTCHQHHDRTRLALHVPQLVMSWKALLLLLLCHQHHAWSTACPIQTCSASTCSITPCGLWHSEPMYVWIPMAAFASKPGVYRRIWSNTECMQASAAPSHSAHCMCCVLLLLHVVA